MKKSGDVSDAEMDAAAKEMKFPSAAALSKIFSDYMEAHSWAVSAIIKTKSLLHYGHAFEDHRPEHVFCLRFSCRSEFKPDVEVERDRRPHCAFLVRESHRYTNLPDWLQVPRDLKRLGGLYMRDGRKAHEYYLSRSDPAYLDVFGVSFVIMGFPIVHYQFIPQYLPRCSSPRPPELGFFQERRIFEDFLILCIGSLAFEFVFRCSGDGLDATDAEDAGVAIPGQLVKEGGSWRWKPLFARWADYDPRRVPRLKRLLEEMETGRSPKYMMQLFHGYASH